MKIVFISSSYPSDKAKVSGVFVRKLVEGLVNSKNCEALVFSPKNFPKNLKRHNALESVNSKSVKVFFPRYLMVKKLPSFSIVLLKISLRTVAFSIYRKIKNSGFYPDLIYAHFIMPNALIAYELSKLMNVPYVVSLGESSFEGIPPKLRAYVREVMDGANRNFAVSNHVKKGFHEAIGHSLKVDVVHNGVDRTLFFKRDKKTSRAILGLDDDSIIIAYTGSLNTRKGFNNLLAAIENLPERIKLICATGSPQVTHERIAICKRYSQEELPIFLSAADIFVFPSIDEGMPNAVLEAMAVGLPIIAMNKPFNRELLGEDDALFIDNNCPDAICDAINKLINDESLKERLGASSEKAVSSFTLSRRVNEVYKRLNEVCS